MAEGESRWCGSKRCGVCKSVVCSKEFKGKYKDSMYKIRGEKLDCNSCNIVYLVSCKTCSQQYVGSTTTKFRLRYNNYLSCYRRYNLKKTVPQMSFHSHFAQPCHNGMLDWEFQLIEQVNDPLLLRKRESYWQYELSTFFPDGLNERDVTFEVG